MNRSLRPAGLVVALLLAAAAAGLVGGTVAQVSECGPLSVDPNSDERTVSEGAAARIVVDVTNEGVVGGSTWVNASAPTGWSTDVDPSSFSLGGQETRSVEVTAQDEGASSDGSPDELTIQADLVCQAGDLGSSGSASAEDTVELQVASTSSSSDGGNPLTGAPGMGLALVGAVAVISVVGYPMVRARQRPAAAIEAVQDVQPVNPGDGVSFPVTIRNDGGTASSFEVELEDVSEGWSGFVARASIDLEPGEEEGVDVLVRAPGSAGPGDQGTIRVRAQPVGEDGEPGKADVVELRAHVERA